LNKGINEKIKMQIPLNALHRQPKWDEWPKKSLNESGFFERL
jgi:hypothetical protein